MAYPGPAEPSRLSQLLRPLGSQALDLLYPRSCRVCDTPLQEGKGAGGGLSLWFCQPCADILPKVEAPFCSVCGEPYDGAISGAFRCSNCADRKFAFEFAIAGYRADGAVRTLIHQFKYGRDLSLRGALADLALRALEDSRLAAEPLTDWLLVPVPLHRSKRMQREFNQSREICRALSRRTRLATVDCLRRVRSTGSQAALDRNQRLKNLRNAFALSRWPSPEARLAGAKVLLVDDVLTTGATTHECARVLKRDGGVQKVVVITVARG